jgi:hypothetical protein
MSFLMMSVARERQELERNRAAAARFVDKENNGPRRYDRSRLIMGHAERAKENRARRRDSIESRAHADRNARKMLKAERIRKKLMEKYTFIPLDNITLEKDKEIRQGFIRSHQDEILSYTRMEILKIFPRYHGSRYG